MREHPQSQHSESIITPLDMDRNIMLDMGNPQERALKLMWLAAMIEAEGSIIFGVTISKHRMVIVPAVNFVNTDELLLEEVSLVLSAILRERAGIVKIRRTVPSKFKMSSSVNAPCSVITLSDMVSVENVLRAIRPYMVGKKRRNADVLLTFIDSRKKTLLERNIETGRLRRQLYTDEEIDLVCSVRVHKNAHSSETLRSAVAEFRQRRDDKVRSALKDAEASRNDLPLLRVAK